MAFCKLLTVLILIHNTGELQGAEVGSSIVGGNDAEEGKWPWMVHVNITDGKTKWRCGGTILSSEWVLTAAHCWDSRLNPMFRRSWVSIGSYQLQKKSERYIGIEFAYRHDRYQAVGSGYVNDIALVKLKKKITFTESSQPVTLPTADDTFGPSSECWITGWGKVGDKIPLKNPETLQELKIPIVPHRVCKAVYPQLNSDMLCAGDKAGGKDACDGDYGGPLVCRKGSSFVQVGIMSYGSPNGCGRPGYPGIYTDVTKYLRFIDYIHQNEEDSAEA